MSDTHNSAASPGAAEMERLRERLYAFIFPSVPRTLEEQAAFEQAAAMQYEHEQTARETTGELPQGVESFRIGDFQMSLNGAASSGALSRRTICPAAYGLLLRSGLLYRGAEGRRAGDAD